MTPFLDQVAEAGLVSPRDFAHEVRGQLQISLGTGQADMAKIRGQKRQFGAEVNVLLAAEAGERQRNASGHGAESGCGSYA